MKYLLLLLLSFNVSAMSIENARDVYYKIGRANGISLPQLVLVYSTDVNASTDGRKVYINSAMLSFVNNEAEIAMVLGHELAHYRLRHRRSTPGNEYAADRLGASYMHNAGYNICRGARVIKRFNNEDSDTHPASRKRYRRLGC